MIPTTSTFGLISTFFYINKIFLVIILALLQMILFIA